MPPFIAAIVVCAGIFGLFMLDRDKERKASPALLLPVIWLLICGSRPVSAWLRGGPATPEQIADDSPIDRAVFILLMTMSMVVLLGRLTAVSRILQKHWLFVLFVVYCAASIMWSDYPDVAAKRWFRSLGDYAVVLVVLTDKSGISALKRVLARAGFILLPLSVLLIKYYPNLGRAYAKAWEGTQFFVGVADDKNMLGMTCMVFGLAAAWRVIQEWTGERSRKVLLVHGTIVATTIWLMSLADSMSSLSCLCLASGVMAAPYFFKFARKRVVTHLSVVTAIVVAYSALFLNLGGAVLNSMGRDSSLTGRTDIWDAVLQVPINRVVGTGFDSFWAGERLQWLWTIPIVKGVNEAHNGYLEMYLNLGVIGVLFLLGLMFTGYWKIIRLMDYDPEGARLRLGYFVIAVVYNFTEAAVRTGALVWIALLLAVIVPEPVVETEPAAEDSGAAVELAQAGTA